jgi:hypothetical protein
MRVRPVPMLQAHAWSSAWHLQTSHCTVRHAAQPKLRVLNTNLFLLHFAYQTWLLQRKSLADGRRWKVAFYSPIRYPV